MTTALELFEQEQAEYAQARAICRAWVARLGGGFHPDNRGSDYVQARGTGYKRFLSAAEIAAYDRDMDVLFSLPTIADPYAIACQALETYFAESKA